MCERKTPTVFERSILSVNVGCLLSCSHEPLLGQPAGGDKRKHHCLEEFSLVDALLEPSDRLCGKSEWVFRSFLDHHLHGSLSPLETSPEVPLPARRRGLTKPGGDSRWSQKVGRLFVFILGVQHSAGGVSDSCRPWFRWRRRATPVDSRKPEAGGGARNEGQCGLAPTDGNTSAVWHLQWCRGKELSMSKRKRHHHQPVANIVRQKPQHSPYRHTFGDVAHARVSTSVSNSRTK